MISNDSHTKIEFQTSYIFSCIQIIYNQVLRFARLEQGKSHQGFQKYTLKFETEEEKKETRLISIVFGAILFEAISYELVRRYNSTNEAKKVDKVNNKIKFKHALKVVFTYEIDSSLQSSIEKIFFLRNKIVHGGSVSSSNLGMYEPDLDLLQPYEVLKIVIEALESIQKNEPSEFLSGYLLAQIRSWRQPSIEKETFYPIQWEG